MRGMPLNPQGEDGSFWSSVYGINTNKRKGFESISAEPNSVLVRRSSLSSPTSSSSDAAASAADKKCTMGVEDLDPILSSSAAPAVSPLQDQTFLQWISADKDNDDLSAGGPMGFDGHGSSFGLIDPGFVFDPITAGGFPVGKVPTFGDPSNSLLYQQDPIEEKPLVCGPRFASNQNFHGQSPAPPNPAFFLPVPPPFTARHAAHQQQMNPMLAGDETSIVDQLFRAAEMVETGDPVSTRGILARLNQQLPSPIGKKALLRSAFYFKEALGRLIANDSTDPIAPLSPPSTLLEVVVKLGAYKVFSEVSPFLQFINFTSIQTVLEELDGFDRIHVIDFDIGIGGQWSSFMQELAQRRSSATTPSLKITAFASHCSHHPLELHLTHENLSHFAGDLGIPFEFNVLSLDPSGLSLLFSMCAGADEAVAVNLPIGSPYQLPLPAILSLVRQISPKVVVSVDNGFDHSELPFSHHFLHALQSSTVLLDSIDSAGTNPDVANKIERFILHPRIESSVMDHRRAGNKSIPWRSLFTSAGLIPMQFSNFTETQAECLLKRVQVRGFHVEKRQASLFLCWQRGELVSVSAWR